MNTNKKLLVFAILLCIALILGFSELNNNEDLSKNSNQNTDKGVEFPKTDIREGEKQNFDYSSQLENYTFQLKEIQINKTNETQNQTANYDLENKDAKKENETSALINYVLSETDTNQDSEIILPNSQRGNSQNNNSENRTKDSNSFGGFDDSDSYGFSNNSVKTNSYDLIAVKITVYNSGNETAKSFKAIDFVEPLQNSITYSQKSDGSWNNNTEDTALAIYSLSYEENTIEKNANENSEMENDSAKTITIENGINYLQSKEKNYFWKTNKETALSIIALNENKIEVKNELKTLSKKQNENGSFGNIEETSWTIIAFAKTNSFKEQREKALNWILTQNPKDERKLALITLAISEHEKSLSREKGVEKANTNTNNFSWIYYIIFLISVGILTAFTLFSKVNSILEGRRREIYDYIKAHPGEHMNKIMKEFSLSPSSATHHLKVLENSSLVVFQKEGKYKRYFANGTIATTNGNKKIIGILKNETAKKIVEFLMKNKANQSYLAEKLKVHPSTIEWHAEKLEEVGVLKKQRNGKEVFYEIGNGNELRNVLFLVNH